MVVLEVMLEVVLLLESEPVAESVDREVLVGLELLAVLVTVALVVDIDIFLVLVLVPVVVPVLVPVLAMELILVKDIAGHIAAK